MNAARWDAGNDPWDMFDWLRCDISVRQQGFWAVACCRRIWDWLSQDCREILQAAEISLERTDYLVGQVDTAMWKDSLNRDFIWSPDTDPAIRAVWMLSGTTAYKSAVGEVADAIARRETGILRPSGAQGWPHEYRVVWRREQAAHADLLREVRGNPYRPVAFNPSWRTSDVMLLAQRIYDVREFDVMPILADALQDAGCDSDDILSHCRDTSLTHVRGCWVVDLVLGKA
jgi:hypothetical protein